MKDSIKNIKLVTGQIYQSPDFVYMFACKKDAGKWVGHMSGWPHNIEAGHREELIRREARIWGDEYGTDVNVISPGENIFVAEQKSIYKKYNADGKYKSHNVCPGALVLTGEKIGWILVKDWMIFQIVKVEKDG